MGGSAGADEGHTQTQTALPVFNGRLPAITTPELMLGDIVISKEKVIAQADEYGHSIEREFAFLIAHSMLHLFGFDHMVDNERLVMEEKQKDILEQLKILR